MNIFDVLQTFERVKYIITCSAVNFHSKTVSILPPLRHPMCLKIIHSRLKIRSIVKRASGMQVLRRIKFSKCEQIVGTKFRHLSNGGIPRVRRKGLCNLLSTILIVLLFITLFHRYKYVGEILFSPII